MPGQQSKDWCFTINNYDDSDIAALEDAVTNGTIIYVIIGKEVAESGTPHLQGFLHLPRKKAMGGVKRISTGLRRSHLERRRGTVDEAVEYCKKEGDFVEYGVKPSAGGRRTGLQGACDIIKDGGSLRDVATQLPTTYVQYRRGLFDLQQALRGVPRTWKTHTTVFWGRRSGTGKSRLARDLAGSDEAPYIFMPSTNGACWFDGYNGQSVAIFDDFEGSQVPFRTMLQVLDRYPANLPIKGGSVSWCPRKVYITSNTSPSTWYTHVRGLDVSPLLRRIDCCHLVEEALYDDIQLPEEDPLADFAQ